MHDLHIRYILTSFFQIPRYYSNCLAPHLKAQDPVPSHVARQKRRIMNSILDFTDSRWLKSRDMARWDPNQPVLQVEKIPFRRNHLAYVEDKEKKELDQLKTYICPQPLQISNVGSNIESSVGLSLQPL